MANVNLPSKERENGIRLRLQLEKATDTLRSKFHEHYSQDPATLNQELSVHRPLFISLKRQKVIYQDQLDLLFPANLLTDSSKFDITLLSLLLSTVCGLAAPQAGWKQAPPPQDQSESAHIIRLRYGRNKLQHGELKVCNTEFTNIWNEISWSLLALGCTQTDIDELKCCPLEIDTVQRLHATEVKLQTAIKQSKLLQDNLNGFCYQVLPPITSFTGREIEIQEIEEKLTNLEDKYMGVVLSGLGGVGKTELTKQFCKEYCLKYNDHNVLWMNSETQETIEYAFHNVAENIGLDTKRSDNIQLNIEEIVSKVYRYFADRRTLFIFDNANDPQLLLKYLNSYFQGNLKKPSVIITSQYADWGQRFVQQKIEVLKFEAAMVLVSNRLEAKYGLTNENNSILCNLVEKLPLALQQATSYILNNDINIEDYIKHFNASSDRFISVQHDDICYLKTVKTTWTMALEKLTDSNNVTAIDMINMMSYINGKEIKKTLFLKACQNDSILLNEAINILKKYSLINLSNTSDGACIVIHSLVQTVIRCQHNNDKYWKMFLKMIFLNDNDANKHHVDFGHNWIRHIDYMVSEFQNNEMLLELIKHINIITSVIYVNVKRILLVLITADDVNELDSINILRNIAHCLQKQGKHKDALIKYYEVEKKKIYILGREHPDLLATQHNIAHCLQNQGKYEDALIKYYHVEKKKIDILGREHPDLLTTQHNIAHCLQDQRTKNKCLIL